MIVWPAKDPAEELDFTWRPSLDEGDTIASVDQKVVISGSAILGVSSNTDSSVTVWLSGGTDGELSMVSLKATTAGGRKFREVGVLPVFDRADEALALFRLNYPLLASTSDGLVSYRLFQALSIVGENWPENIRAGARSAFAAHLVAQSPTDSGIPAGVTSFRSGSFSATLSDAAASRTGLAATLYGREFLALQRRAFGGPRLAWTPPASVDV